MLLKFLNCSSYLDENNGNEIFLNIDLDKGWDFEGSFFYDINLEENRRILVVYFVFFNMFVYRELD